MRCKDSPGDRFVLDWYLSACRSSVSNSPSPLETWSLPGLFLALIAMLVTLTACRGGKGSKGVGEGRGEGGEKDGEKGLVRRERRGGGGKGEEWKRER